MLFGVFRIRGLGADFVSFSILVESCEVYSFRAHQTSSAQGFWVWGISGRES